MDTIYSKVLAAAEAAKARKREEARRRPRLPRSTWRGDDVCFDDPRVPYLKKIDVLTAADETLVRDPEIGAILLLNGKDILSPVPTVRTPGQVLQRDGKKCRNCGQVHPYAAFSADKRNRDGLHSYCKSCRNDQRIRKYHVVKWKRG